jgi:hypothetical protein
MTEPRDQAIEAAAKALGAAQDTFSRDRRISALYLARIAIRAYEEALPYRSEPSSVLESLGLELIDPSKPITKSNVRARQPEAKP